METRTSPRRRAPSRKLMLGTPDDRVDGGRISKRTPTLRQTAAQRLGETRSRTSSAGTVRSRKAASKQTLAAGRQTSPVDSLAQPAIHASRPAQTGRVLRMRRTRSTSTLSQGSAPSMSSQPNVEEWVLLRGSVVSPTNTMMVLVHGEMRPNPFFETMPAPATLRWQTPRLFLAGETTYMQQYIGRQIAHDLAEEKPESNPRPKQTATIFGRLYDQAMGSLGFGKNRKNERVIELPEPWDLPAVSEAEIIRLVQRLPV